MKIASRSLLRVATLGGLLLLGGCASIPTGPSMMALPGSGKTFDQFRFDDAACQDYALNRVGGTTANQSADNAGTKSAVVGTVIGAAAGAAMGGHEGAAVGAGTGLVFGSMAGAGAADSSARGSQQQYDNAYVQCMYAKGHKVPVPASAARSMRQTPAATGNIPQPASRNIPPPPPGNPPPPPPGY